MPPGENNKRKRKEKKKFFYDAGEIIVYARSLYH